jgi:ribosomal protein L19|tara:strand:- start:184 stop:477 length:294 start_codon:yes stop_codon:yes gene_type:complete
MGLKIVKSDQKKFKTMKNRALGASKADKIEVGDMVSWKTWCMDLLTESFETKEGLLIEIIEETRLENVVLIGKILAFGASEYDFIPLFSLTKTTKRD